MNTALLMAVRLAKAGFGPADHILKQNIVVVLASMEFNEFSAGYENAYADLNKEK